MSQCEMCGKETKLFTTLVEGTELNICQPCSKFGKILRTAKIEITILPATIP